MSPAGDVVETCAPPAPRPRRPLARAEADAGRRRHDVSAPAAGDDLRNSSLEIGFCGPEASATGGARREHPPAVDAAAAAAVEGAAPGNESRSSKWRQCLAVVFHCSGRSSLSFRFRLISVEAATNTHTAISRRCVYTYIIVFDKPHSFRIIVEMLLS